MCGPEFEFRAFIGEVQNMKRLAADGGFISSVSAERLSEFQIGIERARADGHPSRSWTISISKELPIFTKSSCGEYQQNKAEVRPVFGELATLWRIVPTGTRKSGGYPSFRVAGQATTRVCIRLQGEAGGDHMQLATWHTDIRSPGGLGCCHHSQVLGESEDPPFPSFLDVPRFPDPFVTPMAILEFLFGELFPIEWDRHVSSGGAQCVRVWRDSQKDIWARRLKTLKTTAAHSESTPWMSIRSWSPT